ncbi:MAG: hypothetical protein IRZ08_12420 [Frankia sp.]|nr:hypothetical protein [Frankia sp.]
MKSVITPFRISTLIATLLAVLCLPLGLVVFDRGADPRPRRRRRLRPPWWWRRQALPPRQAPNGAEQGERCRELHDAFNEKTRCAVQLYGGSKYIQHNPGRHQRLRRHHRFRRELHHRLPRRPHHIRRVFAERDYVIIHSLATGAAPVYSPLGSKFVDIFHLDANGSIVECWDVGAATAPPTPTPTRSF